jgi:DNA-binding transcriptional LysR family regulator
MVLQGLGVSILPDFLIHNELHLGSLVDLYPREQFNFKMKFIKRRTGILSLAAQNFVKVCAKPHAM